MVKFRPKVDYNTGLMITHLAVNVALILSNHKIISLEWFSDWGRVPSLHSNGLANRSKLSILREWPAQISVIEWLFRCIENSAKWTYLYQSVYPLIRLFSGSQENIMGFLFSHTDVYSRRKVLMRNDIYVFRTNKQNKRISTRISKKRKEWFEEKEE